MEKDEILGVNIKRTKISYVKINDDKIMDQEIYYKMRIYYPKN